MYAIAITETLQKIVLVDKPTLDEAFQCAEKAYKESRIVLDADDMVTDALTGKNAVIEHADWIDLDILMETERQIIS